MRLDALGVATSSSSFFFLPLTTTATALAPLNATPPTFDTMPAALPKGVAISLSAWMFGSILSSTISPLPPTLIAPLMPVASLEINPASPPRPAPSPPSPPENRPLASLPLGPATS